MGAYLNTVKKERPEHLPVLARNNFYDIEVCLAPNHCFAMLFEKAEKQNVEVKECGWDYVEGKILSGVSHLVTVYAHEGVTVADAISRGKKDAIRDIRSLEDSDIAKAIKQLEKILQNMSGIEEGGKGAMKLGQRELAKLEPIKDAIISAGPNVDMLAMVDALKNYPGMPTTSSVGDRERALLEKIVADLGDLSDVIRRVESQDQKLEEIEVAMKKTLSELNVSMDERVSKGLALILQSSDKKIDKGFAAIAETRKGDPELPKELEMRLGELEKNIQAISMQVQAVQAKPSVDPEDVKGLEERLKEAEAAMLAMQAKPSVQPDTVQALEERLQKAEGEVTALQTKPAVEPELLKQLGDRLQRIEGDVTAVQTMVQESLSKKDERSPVVEELVLAIADLKENIARTNNRIIRVEEYLAQMSGPRVRRLKQDQAP
jgi:predicted  nucleic acid-binding Zn-ribbon protein